jgi:thiol-disulfide isomerase/thioredoxin
MDRQFLAMKLSHGDIRLELLEHSVDHVVLFHAPWCAHCEQLFPYWEVIASNLYNRQTDVVVGLLDCEVDQDHEELCTELMIEQYPTVMFIGSGEMNQVSNGGIFPTSAGVGKKQNPRVVVYESDLYPHVLYEWIKWMSGISSFQRRMGMFWQGFSTILTATGLYSQMDAVNPRQHAVSSKDSVHSARIAELLASSEALEAQVQQCEVEVDRFKTLEMFDSLKNFGDVFTLLHTEGGSDGVEETHPIDEYARSLVRMQGWVD